MLHERPTRGRSETSGRRPSERSTLAGLQATSELELRERLVTVVDALDAGDSDTAAINVRWLLEDLDAA